MAETNILQDDFGNAIKAAIIAALPRFPMIGYSDGQLRVEYGHNAVFSEELGRLLIRPLPVLPVEGELYKASGESAFRFALEFDSKDVKGKGAHRQLVAQAVLSTLGDGGDQVHAVLVDSGSNLLRNSGLLTIENVAENETLKGRDWPSTICEVVIDAWHRVPFRYPPVPDLDLVTAATGPAAGGTLVTLTGSWFAGATGVTFGGVAATSVVVVNRNKITCITPAHAAGAVSVVVTTPSGANGANALFTYV